MIKITTDRNSTWSKFNMIHARTDGNSNYSKFKLIENQTDRKGDAWTNKLDKRLLLAALVTWE